MTAANLHAERRRRLVEAMRAAGGGVAVVATAPARRRNGDTEHPYRADSGFLYLTGFAEPHAVLVLDAVGRSVLFCRPSGPEGELWEGVRLGTAAAPAALGVDEACDIALLGHRLPALLAGRPALWWPFGGEDEAMEARLYAALAALRTRPSSEAGAPAVLRDLGPALGELRLVKDDAEQDAMRRAAAISAGAHVRAMRFCAARLRADPAGGVHEHEIEAELLHEFRRHGAAGPAYPSIVAAGASACVLHHPAGSSTLRAGELCLVDAGCEVDGYASDITRTFPADGRFRAEQRALYDVVLAAHDAAVDRTRPGARRLDGHWAAVRVLSQGLLDLGLLDRAVHGDADAVVERAAYRTFYMHGTGHWLGLDVHDAGEYLALDEAPVEQPDPAGGRTLRPPSRVLRPGMVLTVEPGLYVRPAAGVPERFWHLGIRIEDVALVTGGGCELLSRGAPVEPDAIEALMRVALTGAASARATRACACETARG